MTPLESYQSALARYLASRTTHNRRLMETWAKLAGVDMGWLKTTDLESRRDFRPTNPKLEDWRS